MSSLWIFKIQQWCKVQRLNYSSRFDSRIASIWARYLQRRHSIITKCPYLIFSLCYRTHYKHCKIINNEYLLLKKLCEDYLSLVVWGVVDIGSLYNETRQHLRHNTNIFDCLQSLSCTSDSIFDIRAPRFRTWFGITWFRAELLSTTKRKELSS